MSRCRRIPEKACAEPTCGRVKRPRYWKDYFSTTWCCSRSCASKRLYRLRMGKVLRAATSKRNKRQHRERIAALVGRTYGELSVRDIELFNLGVKVGYNRGYAKGYDSKRRQPKSPDGGDDHTSPSHPPLTEGHAH